MHDLKKWQRIDTQPEHTNRQYAQHKFLTAIDIDQCFYLFVSDLTINDSLDHPKCIGCTEDKRKTRNSRVPTVNPEATQDD